MAYRLSKHAQLECERRHIPIALVDAVVREPQQVLPAHDGKRAYQSRVLFPDGREWLLRAIVDDRVQPAVVVTVYRTSKLTKYWSIP
jgi:hypothetical protein